MVFTSEYQEYIWWDILLGVEIFFSLYNIFFHLITPCSNIDVKQTLGCLNIWMLSYQLKISNYEYNVVSQWSYLYYRNLYIW